MAEREMQPKDESFLTLLSDPLVFDKICTTIGLAPEIIDDYFGILGVALDELDSWDVIGEYTLQKRLESSSAVEVYEPRLPNGGVPVSHVGIFRLPNLGEFQQFQLQNQPEQDVSPLKMIADRALHTQDHLRREAELVNARRSATLHVASVDSSFDTTNPSVLGPLLASYVNRYFDEVRLRTRSNPNFGSLRPAVRYTATLGPNSRYIASSIEYAPWGPKPEIDLWIRAGKTPLREIWVRTVGMGDRIEDFEQIIAARSDEM